jgi:hypothetical protein
MTELKLNLDFACHACRRPVGVTVRCAGRNLTESAVAAVSVPCPGCGHVSRVVFAADGTVHDVRPVHPPARVPEPSVN